MSGDAEGAAPGPSPAGLSPSGPSPAGPSPSGDGAQPRWLAARVGGFPAASLALAAAFAPAAWAARFLQDDAYISFRYAANIARGLGPVWQPGEAVFGFTNPAWTYLIAAAVALGGAPEAAAMALGILFALVCLLAVARLGATQETEPAARLAAPLLLAGCWSVLRYATGGLETSMQAAAVAVSMLALARCLRPGAGPGAFAALSLALGAAGWVRLDSAVFVAVFAGAAALAAWRSPRRGAALAALAGPGAALLAGYLAWSLLHFGTAIPNTFAAKQAAGLRMQMEAGAIYVAQFLVNSGLAIVGLGALVFARSLLRSPFHAALLAGVLAWAAYVVAVGGDFMEFRFLVPGLPPLAVLGARVFALATAALSPAARRGALAALALGLLGHSTLQAVGFRDHRWIESTWELEAHIARDGWNWIGMGEALARAFPQGFDGPVIAVTAAGAIPYASGLPTVDMLGLTDPWTARHGVELDRVGHRRLATLDHLLDRGVALMIGSPEPLPEAEAASAPHRANWALATGPSPSPEALAALRRARSLTLPFGEGMRLPMLYLVPDARVDAAIAAGVLSDHGPAIWAGAEGD
ncbi:hypothetical protein [Albimonas pacifica]|uniref:4-amino-4-deoxy-L-arabinose transferase n=1 Tax=Albimonas pacifica TaxID=1114924 RepID=A0A1I3E459_9RHOB|nr:hypothetical protein [Albimonas pacifica]SFH93481.1 hypothetical protein SAMN05216258_103163 [Albimonas pacifica]